MRRDIHSSCKVYRLNHFQAPRSAAFGALTARGPPAPPSPGPRPPPLTLSPLNTSARRPPPPGTTPAVCVGWSRRLHVPRESGTTRCLSFCVWLISLGVTSSGFIRGAACVGISPFSRLSSIPLYETHGISFIRRQTCGCFPPLGRCERGCTDISLVFPFFSVCAQKGDSWSNDSSSFNFLRTAIE